MKKQQRKNKENKEIKENKESKKSKKSKKSKNKTCQNISCLRRGIRCKEKDSSTDYKKSMEPFRNGIIQQTILTGKIPAGYYRCFHTSVNQLASEAQF